MRARRALLYTPGDDPSKIHKAAHLGADCVCLDMEDGVAANRKIEARASIREALLTIDFGKSERLVRINPVGSRLESLDLSETLPSRPDGVVIPKVDNAEQVRWVSEIITEYEHAQGWPDGGICLIAIVESARAIINLLSIASSDRRLQALIFGAEDFVGDVGATRTRAGWEVFYARSRIVTYATAYNLQAIDQVFLDFHDTQGLQEDANLGMQMGFSGKQIIHPNQVAPVQEAFTPSDEAIANAIHLIETYTRHQEAGQGAFGLDGKMIDAPIVKSAQRVLDRARAAGKL